LERYLLDVFDFRTLHYAKDPTLNMRAPINGVSAVKVFLKGVQVAIDDPNFGYSIVPDPLRLEPGYTFSKIMFNKQVRLSRPLIEVSYLTRQGFCLQCSGTGQVRDWSVSHSGALVRVEKTDKLVQQSLKYILSSKNPPSPNLVSHLKDYVAKKFNLTVSASDIATEITRVLQAYQAIQGSQKTVQTLDPAEILRDIQNASVQQDPENPNLIYVSLTVTAYGATKPIPLNIALQTTS
jgi:hypothetical protein